MLDFTELQNRYVFEGNLHLQGAMHIGSGRSDEEVDSVFACTSDNRPYIPGSSIRGALRSHTERILLSIRKPSCLLFSDSTFENPVMETKCLTAQKPDELAEIEQDELYENIMANPDLLCDTCKVYGSPHFASRVKIPDAIRAEQTPLNKRFNTGINRETGTVASGVLFSMNVVEKGNAFPFKLIAENMEPLTLGVLAIGLLEMMSGEFWIGAKAATGLGQCKLELSSVKYFGDDGVPLRQHILATTETEKFTVIPQNAIATKLRDWASAYINTTEEN